MYTKWAMSMLVALLLAAPSVWADATKAKTSGADPATKTLPASASDTAKANAFGQQGARSKAAHQAAHATATQQVHDAAGDAHGQPAGSTTRPSAAALSHASATGVSNGFDHAAAGSANGQGAAHRHQ